MGTFTHMLFGRAATVSQGWRGRCTVFRGVSGYQHHCTGRDGPAWDRGFARPFQVDTGTLGGVIATYRG
jgi:hypothetical protein